MPPVIPDALIRPSMGQPTIRDSNHDVDMCIPFLPLSFPVCLLTLPVVIRCENEQNTKGRDEHRHDSHGGDSHQRSGQRRGLERVGEQPRVHGEEVRQGDVAICRREEEETGFPRLWRRYRREERGGEGGERGRDAPGCSRAREGEGGVHGSRRSTIVGRCEK